jgi:hypothetical protein
MTLQKIRKVALASVLCGVAMLATVPASAQTVSVGATVSSTTTVGATANTDLFSQLLSLLGMTGL